MKVFLDIDTQYDFLLPAGALYVPDAERIIPAIARLNRFASSEKIPLISTMDAHTENDPEFRSYPPHCVAGTLGQQKPGSTMVENQILFPKVTIDAFATPDLDRLLTRLQADHFVVYGVVAEICVSCAIQGLLRRGRVRIELVSDAVKSLDHVAANQMFAEFADAGGVLTSVERVIG